MTLIKSVSGIRGTIGGKVGEALTPVDVAKFSSAFGTWVKQNNAGNKVIIGRDARISGEMVAGIVSSCLRGLGLHVIDLGLATTPTVEMAVLFEKAAGAIIITASHNPIQWNALKLLNQNGEFLSDIDGQKILQLVEKDEFDFADVKDLGSYAKADFTQRHIDAILALPLVDKKAIAEKNFSVVIDCSNSVGGIALPMLLEALGVKSIKKLYCEPDGNFQHNPEPLPENLTAISSELAGGKYDLGIVVDPDVDRLCFINEDGSFFGEEYTLVAIADYILSHKTGNTVSNLSSSLALKDVTEKYKGSYSASPTGEYFVVKKMKETNAIIGGEGNGGVIYPELHYGRDAMVGIALFLTQLAKFGKSISMLRSKYPNYYISKNKIELTPEIDVNYLIREIKNKYKNFPVNDTDGVRIDFDKEWVLLRKSNTEPIIRIYAESGSQTTAQNLASKIIGDIKELIAKDADILR